MNILNKQIDSIYDRQKNLYSKYPHYSPNRMQKVKRYANEKKSQQHLERMYWVSQKEIKKILILCIFSDSAMVSRAVARGYVTVNGKEVELTEDTKQQLLKTDKEASAAREKAYQDC